jgi:hypothetical protein
MFWTFLQCYSTFNNSNSKKHGKALQNTFSLFAVTFYFQSPKAYLVKSEKVISKAPKTNAFGALAR